MTKQISRRRVAKPPVPGIKALVTTASIAATLGGWALFANQNSYSQDFLAQQAQELSAQPQVPALNVSALPALDPLPTVVPPPSGLAGSGFSAQIQIPAQVPTVASEPKTLAPAQSLRQVKPPAVSRKPAPRAVTRSSR
ncbi:MAG: hypothetical protein ABI670_06800 [Chloroflexota bacterium]